MTTIISDYKKEHARKSAELHLPYFKQGDDLGHYLEKNKTNLEALVAHAEMLEYAASILRNVAEEIREVDKKIEINADTHMIYIEGPEEFMDNLVPKYDCMDFPEWEEEYDDDENEDCYIGGIEEK